MDVDISELVRLQYPILRVTCISQALSVMQSFMSRVRDAPGPAPGITQLDLLRQGVPGRKGLFILGPYRLRASHAAERNMRISAQTERGPKSWTQRARQKEVPPAKISATKGSLGSLLVT